MFFLCLSNTTLQAQGEVEQPTKSLRLLKFFKNDQYVVAPIVSYLPETSWKFGLGVKYLFRPSSYDSSTTRKSFIAGSAEYSLKNQFVVQPYFTYFFNNEQFVLDGFYSYKKFPQNYYGIGNDKLDVSRELVDLKEVKVEQIVFTKIKGKLFAGGGFRFVGYYDVQQEMPGTLISEKPTGYDGFHSFGASANIRFDNRDNILNAHNGAFADLRLESMNKATDDSSPYTLLKVDLRKYTTPFESRQDVLAGQLCLKSTLNGDVPFPEMPAVGSDVIMRGYYARRYIDRHFIGGQVEYRIPLPYKFGLVGFAGLGDVASNIQDFQLRYIKYSIGAGIRYKIIPKEDINVRLDFGLGRGSQTFYVNIAEAF